MNKKKKPVQFGHQIQRGMCTWHQSKGFQTLMPTMPATPLVV